MNGKLIEEIIKKVKDYKGKKEAFNVVIEYYMAGEIASIVLEYRQFENNQIEVNTDLNYLYYRTQNTIENYLDLDEIFSIKIKHSYDYYNRDYIGVIDIKQPVIEEKPVEDKIIVDLKQDVSHKKNTTRKNI